MCATDPALALLREMGERTNRLGALNSLYLVEREQGDYDRARSLGEERLTVAQEHQDRREIAYALNDLGYLAYAQGDLGTAQALLERSLSLRRDLGDLDGIGF